MLIRMACIFALLFAIGFPGATAEELPPDQDEPSGYLVPEERSGLDLFRPNRSGWLVWVGPVLMGLAAFLLVLFIRNFSRHRHGQDAGPPDDDDRRR
ncbi:MAG: hypothetical protein EA370_14380 [Wenzhouxiangella sp.]|nr:MAG: hypothetical protein EA370_14380 [Wenzhouxiangella sp.]